VGYELLLRSPAPDQPVAEEALAQELQSAFAGGVPSQRSSAAPDAGSAPAPAAPTSGSASLPQAVPWIFKNGKGRVEGRPWRTESGVLRGVDLDIPFGGTEADLRAAFTLVVGLADRLHLAVFDPQLACLVGRGSEEAVVGRWRESQAWAIDMLGAYGDAQSQGEIAAPPPLITRGNKILLGAIGLLILLWVLWTSLAAVSR